mgnify:CR=1 FL=1
MTGLALPNGTSRRASGATNDSVWKSCTDLGHRRSAANQLPPSPGPQTNTQPSIRDVLWDVGHRRGGPALTSGRPAASSAPDWASCLVPTSCGQPAAFPTRSPSEASVCPKKRNVRFARSQLPQSTQSGRSLARLPDVREVPETPGGRRVDWQGLQFRHVYLNSIPMTRPGHSGTTRSQFSSTT